MKILLCAALAVLVPSSYAIAQSQPQSQQQSKTTTPAKPAAKSVSQQQSDDGGRKFDQNCNRCHTVPDRIPPSTMGTVIKHMRVRANLSEQDTQDILRFLAP